MIMKHRLIKIICLLALLLFLPLKAFASDLDIYTGEPITIPPNVLIILDISGSMKEDDVTDLYTGARSTRIAVAQQVITEMVNKHYESMRFGLMVFPRDSNSNPGRVVFSCANFIPGNAGSKNSFLSALRNYASNPVGGTPLASSLAEAGLYFAGQTSFFHTANVYSGISGVYQGNKYISPIDSVCRSNYVILITDGVPSVDHGVKNNSSGRPGSSLSYKYNFPASYRSVLYTQGAYMGSTIGDYIKNKTFPDNPGYQLGNLFQDLVYPFDFKDNKVINPSNGKYTYAQTAWGLNTASNNSYIGTITASKIDQWKTSAEWNNIITRSRAGEIAFYYGYNADNPSQSIMEPRVDTNTSYRRNDLMMNYYGYIKDTQIYQANWTTSGAFGSDYLDDVAAFLYNEDMNLEKGTPGSKYEKQIVKTYVIGFKEDFDLLLRTAIQGGTGKEGYYTANEADELAVALDTIVASIRDDAATYSTAVIPSTTDNQLKSDKYIYLSYFKPKTGSWMGNVKRYELDEDYTLDSKTDETGAILPNAKSDWLSASAEPDGSDVEKGGIYVKINQQINGEFKNAATARKVYTFTGSNPDLTVIQNQISVSNTHLSAEMLGVENEQARINAINTIRNATLGPIIHSRPAITNYGDKRIFFVGSNDGFLHCIDDDTGKEIWAFVMPEHLSKIKDAYKANPLDDEYFVDGIPIIRIVNSKKVLIIGARRGGSSFVGLDITDYNNPYFLYEVADTLKSNGQYDYFLTSSEAPADALGFSWSTPKLYAVHKSMSSGGSSWVTSDIYNTRIQTGAVYNNIESVAVMGGGYDPKYDEFTSNLISTPKGASILAFSPFDGKVNTTFENLKPSKNNMLKHSILEVAAADLNSDSLLDTIYFGDQGGNLFYAVPYEIKDRGTTRSMESSFEFNAFKLFQSSGTGNESLRKIQYAPDVVIDAPFKHFVYFGTGDREDPLDTFVENRFYCIHNKNPWKLATKASDSNYLTEADLVDVTDNLIQVGTDQEKEEVQEQLDRNDKYGWYIRLVEGEKVTSSPTVYKGVVFFTTFIPFYEGATSDDECVEFSNGVTRLYAINYKNGAAVWKWDKSEVTDENPLMTEDRHSSISDGLSGGFTLGHFDDINMLYSTSASSIDNRDLGHDNGPPNPPGTDPDKTKDYNFWKQILE